MKSHKAPQEIRPLHTEIMKRTSLTGILLIAVVPLLSCLAVADERDDRIRALEKRVEQLEQLLQKQDVKPASSDDALKPAESRKPTASLSVDSSGFTLRSADTNFALRIRGLLQVDSRWYVDDGGIDDNDGFFLRRARPILEGTLWRDFEFRFTPEFGGSSVAIRDAWLNYRYTDGLQLNMGKMKPPGALERWQSAANISFIERSLVSGLWPVRELGAMFHGELWPGEEKATKRLAATGVINYGLGVFNGIGDDRATGNSNLDDDVEFAARLFVHPFLRSGLEPIRNLGLGLAGTYGNTEGALGLPDGGAYTTEGQQDLFSYLSGDGTTPATANVIADGIHWRLGPQAYWYYGPFGLQGEYGISSQELQRQDGTVSHGWVNHQAWSVTASWLLTGEEATFRAVAPKKNFDPRAGGFGALQFVARYSVLDLDDDAFPSFADPSESATRANTWGVGLNWFLNRNVRASLNFLQTDFEGGDDGPVTRQNENVFLTRAQLSF